MSPKLVMMEQLKYSETLNSNIYVNVYGENIFRTEWKRILGAINMV